MSLKDSVKGSLRQLGWDVKRFNSLDSEWVRLAQLLSIHRVNVVFDVGANTGQFARNLLDSSFNGRIISFEPLSSAHRELERRARGKTNWTVAQRVAIGDRDGKAVINVSQNSVSSSMLPIRETHVHAEATSRYVMTEEVNLRKLDTIAPEYAKASDRVFLKVDVQGFEYQVLEGAPQFLSKAVGIQMELSLISLYEGDHLFVAMLREMESRGFGLWSLIPGFVDPSTGRLLQVDGVFVKTTIPEPRGLACISIPATRAP